MAEHGGGMRERGDRCVSAGWVRRSPL
jgi:hypothetical protein